jgi:hypothetical protein
LFCTKNLITLLKNFLKDINIFMKSSKFFYLFSGNKKLFWKFIFIIALYGRK